MADLRILGARICWMFWTGGVILSLESLYFDDGSPWDWPHREILLV